MWLLSSIVILLFDPFWCRGDAVDVSGSAIGCRNEDGDPVDWFVIYKTPKMSKHPNPLVRRGLAYFYMDAEKKEFRLSARNLNTTNTALGHTLTPVYEDGGGAGRLGYLFYNDQTPETRERIDGESNGAGHMKGALAFNNRSGWWLVSSLPQFPPPKSSGGYSLSHNAHYYGQTFLCLSLNVDAFKTVGLHLFYAFPHVYDFGFPPWVQEKLPRLWKVARRGHVETKPFFHRDSILTSGGLNLTTFAKSEAYGKDIYHDFIAPSLKTALLVETWRNDKRLRLKTNCEPPFDVYNVGRIDFGVKPGVAFKYSKDHSKWAISTDKLGDGHGMMAYNDVDDRLENDRASAIRNDVDNKVRLRPSSFANADDRLQRFHDVDPQRLFFFRRSPTRSSTSSSWTCLGGINRESSQFHRGGGGVCVEDADVWKAFHGIVAEHDPCPTGGGSG